MHEPLSNQELLIICYLLDMGWDHIPEWMDLPSDILSVLPDSRRNDLEFLFEQFNSGGSDYEPGNWTDPVYVMCKMMEYRILVYLASAYELPDPTFQTKEELLRQIREKLGNG